MDLYIKDNLNKIKLTVKVRIFGMMEENILEHGKKIK